MALGRVAIAPVWCWAGFGLALGQVGIGLGRLLSGLAMGFGLGRVGIGPGWHRAVQLALGWVVFELVWHWARLVLGPV